MQAKMILSFPEDRYSALSSFSSLVEVLSDWKNSDSMFQGVDVEKQKSRNYLIKRKILR